MDTDINKPEYVSKREEWITTIELLLQLHTDTLNTKIMEELEEIQDELRLQIKEFIEDNYKEMVIYGV